MTDAEMIALFAGGMCQGDARCVLIKPGYGCPCADVAARLEAVLKERDDAEREYSLILDRYNRQGLSLGMAERELEAADTALLWYADRCHHSRVRTWIARRNSRGGACRSSAPGEDAVQHSRDDGEGVMKEPVDHILRPRLPWRQSDEGAITECGFDASKVKTLTRPEFFRRVKDLGQQRTAMMTCMTCSDTARRWGTWDDDPRVALMREIEWERGGYYGRGRDDRGQRLRDELTVLADLIEAHRDEFDAALKAIEQRREWLERKAAMESKPKVARPRGLL